MFKNTNLIISPIYRAARFSDPSDFAAMAKVRDEAYLKQLGGRIRKLRTDKELSQYQLADVANISRSQIIGIEKGDINPTVCTLRSISDGLGMSVAELLTF
jgi:DNA-binding XRE family transcriptional regulator